MKPQEIAKELDIDNKNILGSWLSRKDTIIDTVTRLPENSIKWDQFLLDTKADKNTGTLYDRIEKIEYLPVTECPIVMDLTTSSDIHTFVSNGFVTHNCPAETPEGAGCTDIDSKVLLSDGSLKRIRNLEKTYREASISTVNIDDRKSLSTDVVAFQNLNSEKFGKKSE